MQYEEIKKRYDTLNLRQPNYAVMGGISWLIRIICNIVGWGFMIAFVLLVITIAVQTKIQDPIFGGDEVRHAYLVILTVLCLMISLPCLFVAWLTRGIIRRNEYIETQKEFMRATLTEYHALENATGMVRETTNPKDRPFEDVREK